MNVLADRKAVAGSSQGILQAVSSISRHEPSPAVYSVMGCAWGMTEPEYGYRVVTPQL